MLTLGRHRINTGKPNKSRVRFKHECMMKHMPARCSSAATSSSGTETERQELPVLLEAAPGIAVLAGPGAKRIDAAHMVITVVNLSEATSNDRLTSVASGLKY